jgi:hypothetical protein
MADLRYDQFSPGTPTGSRIILHADPATGDLEKCAISDVNALVQVPINIPALISINGNIMVAHAMGLNPILTNTNFTIINSTAYFTAIPTNAFTSTGAYIRWSGGGVYTSVNFSGWALYEVSGTTLSRVAITANQTSAFAPNSSVIFHTPWTSPVALQAKFYWAAFVFNWSAVSTTPIAAQAAASGVLNYATLKLDGNMSAYASLASQTTLASSYNISSLSFATNQVPWCGIY